MSRSRYDELHDRFSSGASSKAGTRYERLAALALKSVNPERVVIHDLKLIGSSKVKHQIDVVVSDGHGRRRVLVECKDFDISGEKVGLEIVRSFFGAVEDIRPDDAFVISCIGFTRPAQTYAKAKGIQLVVLRIFEDDDWEGRIKTINLQINAISPPRVRSADLRMSANAAQLFAAQAQKIGMNWPNVTSLDPVFLRIGSERFPLFDRLTDIGSAPAGSILPHVETVDLSPDEYQLQIGDEPAINFESLKVQVETPAIAQSNVVIGNDLEALLLMRGYQGKDVIIFDNHLKKLAFSSSPT